MSDSYMRRACEALESIAKSQEVMADAIKAEETRAEERMEIMRKIGQEVEANQAQAQVALGMVTKQ